MKGIVVTEYNFNMIVSKLEKFLSHRKFRTWHQFKGGMHKRIGHYVCIELSEGIKLNVMRSVLVWKCEKRYHTGKPIFAIYADDIVKLVRLGMTVWFLGNRVIFKEPYSLLPERKYLYTCFQIDK